MSQSQSQLTFEYTGTATDPFGNARFGFEGESESTVKISV
jgi:hypothetical protein